VGHPVGALLAELAKTLFSQMGLNPVLLDNITNADYGALVPVTELPIHPAIATHFRLRFIGAEHRYTYFGEGRFTFEEYALRYMNFIWDPLLAEGFDAGNKRDFARSAELLEQALKVSLRSAHGHVFLSDIYMHLGQHDKAVDHAHRAVAIEPDNQKYLERVQRLGDIKH